MGSGSKDLLCAASTFVLDFAGSSSRIEVAVRIQRLVGLPSCRFWRLDLDGQMMVGMSDSFCRSKYATILNPDHLYSSRSYGSEAKILFGKDSIVYFSERQLE